MSGVPSNVAKLRASASASDLGGPHDEAPAGVTLATQATTVVTRRTTSLLITTSTVRSRGQFHRPRQATGVGATTERRTSGGGDERWCGRSPGGTGMDGGPCRHFAGPAPKCRSLVGPLRASRRGVGAPINHSCQRGSSRSGCRHPHPHPHPHRARRPPARGPGPSPSDHRRRLFTLAGFSRYATEEGVIEHSPAVHVRRPRLPRRGPRPQRARRLPDRRSRSSAARWWSYTPRT